MESLQKALEESKYSEKQLKEKQEKVDIELELLQHELRELTNMK